RDLLFVNQVVENGRDAELAFGVEVRPAVLENHDAGGFLTVVGGGDVDPVVAHGAREDGALPGVLRDLSPGHARLVGRIGAELVVVGGVQGKVGEQNKDGGKNEAHGNLQKAGDYFALAGATGTMMFGMPSVFACSFSLARSPVSRPCSSAAYSSRSRFS